ncbi:MAG: 3-methylornithine--L-lysine ligase PylC [Syntrophomonadaceae bacterium]|jgi:pyrrolysine biosynthesis protein PylC|nr:3-methylornithine--L-lysine ligase PylC [Syntrophomonadaceae bacterium]
MTKILIAGGKLQGTEIAYLAKKAGYYSIMVDKRPVVPAGALVNEHIQNDIFAETEMLPVFQRADIIIPAIEDKSVLSKIVDYAEITQTPLVFDQEAYLLSSSKKASNDWFERLGLSVPGKYPHCGYPVIIKPDGLSGSRNVYKAASPTEANSIIESMKGDFVAQEFLPGRSFSMEVIGDGRQFSLLPVTEVITDKVCDCKRVIAPADISSALEQQFFNLASKIAGNLKINGIFDIEVICQGETLKLLEIDARFPSQTPISIFHAYGLNMVEILTETALSSMPPINKSRKAICYYQNISVDRAGIRVSGENIMSRCADLAVIEGFFGSDEGITDYREGSKSWKAIIIVTADTYEYAYQKFLSCVNNIRNEYQISSFEEG